MPSATNNIVVTPFVYGPEKKINFGAVITGANLDNLDDASFDIIRNALYTHNVVILKGQQDLNPANQFKFSSRFNPGVDTASHGFGYGMSTAKELGPLAKARYIQIPGSGGVTLVGHGYQGKDHYGLKDLDLKSFSHVDYHDNPLSEEEMEAGQTRFVAFHFDGKIYASHPSRVTTLRCIKAPGGPDQTIRFDDGTGNTMTCRPGSTAFISGSQMYDLMTDEEKKIMENSYYQPAPHPFAWSGTRLFRENGVGLKPGGKTMPFEELPPWTADGVRKYPLLWVNPVTGVKSLQVMPETVHKLYLKDGPDGTERCVEDLEEIRVFLNKFFDRVMKPEYVMIAECEQGDMVAWNNWGVMHSAIEYPVSFGSRSMHQCHIASATPPVGPQDIQT